VLMLKEIIYNHFDKEEQHVTDPTAFSPSSFNSCLRQLYYGKTSTIKSNPVDNHAKLKMRLGTASHEMLQKMFQDEGIWVEGEDLKIKEFDGLTIRYRIDGLVKIKDQTYITEIKTIYGEGFRQIEQTPKTDHLTQLVLYLILECQNNGILLYIGRDNGRMLEYGVRIINEVVYIDHPEYELVNETLIPNIHKRAAELGKVRENILNKHVPDREFKSVFKFYNGEVVDEFTKDKVKYKSDWQCSYCGWRDMCWENEMEEAKCTGFYVGGNNEQ